jgi:hypothetical protein
MDAAADSLIHQYKLLSEYRYLYQNAPQTLKPFTTQGSDQENQKTLSTRKDYLSVTR